MERGKFLLSTVNIYRKPESLNRQNNYKSDVTTGSQWGNKCNSISISHHIGNIILGTEILKV